ncbi:alpha/beta fold hydrolase [Paenibacillus sp. MBLB4367]|uniref:alpha/beta fold hydrolase n=1 Tax=Paenibacillus sp. MBLB4367 TaxID=3384767 RepID=UPI0039083F45
MQRFKKAEGKALIYDSYDVLLAQWGVDKKELDFETPYGMTHAIVCGNPDNPPLLLFHGVGDNAALMWIYNMRELARYFYVIAVDTIGGPGKSEPNEAYFKHFKQSLWIDSIWDYFGLDKAHIAGVSNGAYLAGCYTAKHPDKVRGVVCMAGGIKISPVRMLLAFLPEALFPTEANTRRLLRKLTAPGSDAFESNPELLLHWSYLLKYFNNRSMMVHKYVPFTEADLAVLREKALFLIGEFDRLSNYPKAIQALQVHGLTYRIVKSAGHGINHEQPEKVHEEMIRFLLEEKAYIP